MHWLPHRPFIIIYTGIIRTAYSHNVFHIFWRIFRYTLILISIGFDVWHNYYNTISDYNFHINYGYDLWISVFSVLWD